MFKLKSFIYTLVVIALIALGVYGLYKRNESLIVENTKQTQAVNTAKSINKDLNLKLDRTIEINSNNQKTVQQFNKVKIDKIKQTTKVVQDIKTIDTTQPQELDKSEEQKALEVSSMVFSKIKEHELQMGNIT